MSSSPTIFPAKAKLRLCFAHGTYDMKPMFEKIAPDIDTFQVSTYDDLKKRVSEADVLVVSGLWKNELLEYATNLKYVQSVSSGTNQYDLDAFKKQHILLASGSGVNMNAVSEHAIALMLSLTRRVVFARDNQLKNFWRPEQTNPADREIEMPGKTMLIIGTGRIGNRIAKIAKAMDMRVIGVRRNPAAGAGAADEVHSFTDLKTLLPQADVVVLSCPLTEETRNIMDKEALSLLKPTAYLINVARGACVDEEALIEVLESGKIAGAGLDVMVTEPLPATSKLWALPNVILTPHAAGETSKYEINVLSILEQNLNKLWSGDDAIVNRIV